MKHVTNRRDKWSGGGKSDKVYRAMPSKTEPAPGNGLRVQFDVVEPPNLVLDEIVSEDVEGPRSRWKRFEHYKMVQEQSRRTQYAFHDTTAYNSDPLDYSGGLRGRYESTVFGVTVGSLLPGTYYAPHGLPSMHDSAAEDPGFVPVPVLLDSLTADALRVIMPQIKSELSVLNAVYELKDFKHLVLRADKVLKQIASMGLPKVFKGTLKELANVFSKARESKPFKHRIAGSAASIYLQWKFAVAPLIQDIQSTWAAVSKTEEILRRFLNNAEKRRIGHFSKTYREYDDYDIVEPPSARERPQPNAGILYAFLSGWTRYVSHSASKFHVEVEYSYYLPHLVAAHARLFAYLDRFGLNLNPAIIWNAIPYTFLLDWVVGVSRFLDGLKIGFTDPVVCIHQYLWSITRERKIAGTVSYPSFGSMTPVYQKYGLPYCVETAYRRETRMPVKSLFVSTSGLSPVEISLGAALLVSRRARKRSRHW